MVDFLKNRRLDGLSWECLQVCNYEWVREGERHDLSVWYRSVPGRCLQITGHRGWKGELLELLIIFTETYMWVADKKAPFSQANNGIKGV